MIVSHSGLHYGFETPGSKRVLDSLMQRIRVFIDHNEDFISHFLQIAADASIFNQEDIVIVICTAVSMLRTDHPGKSTAF